MQMNSLESGLQKGRAAFLSFPPFFSRSPLYSSFPLPLFTSHQPPQTLGCYLVLKSLDFLMAPVQRLAILEAQGRGGSGC